LALRPTEAFRLQTLFRPIANNHKQSDTHTKHKQKNAMRKADQRRKASKSYT